MIHDQNVFKSIQEQLIKGQSKNQFQFFQRIFNGHCAVIEWAVRKKMVEKQKSRIGIGNVKLNDE